MTARLDILTLCVIAFAIDSCYGYGYGPPTTICVDMFPIGHYVNASTDAPPFELVVNATSYQPGDVVEIQLNAKTDTRQADGRAWFYEGVFVQVRSQDCNTPVPLGKFSVMAGEDFLQPMKCLDLEKSAIRHYDHAHIYNRTFYWTAPSQAVGHVYIRATVARNMGMFWTNVFSPLIADQSDSTSTANFSPCAVRTDYREQDWCSQSDQTSASHTPVLDLLLLGVGVLLLFVSL